MKTKVFNNKSYDVVFKAAKKALKDLDMNILEADFERKTIIASTRTSLFSWGEDIQVRFKVVGNNINVTIDSNSKAQLIDWGRNSSNEKEIIEEITDTLKKR